ncbi:MAG: ATP-binding protein [Clostridiales bacterium]|jgi:hypothetical protein|nr:ATP-binding protein [Clostridiales bacterium]
MDFKPVIVTGAYGCGKTEFCVNYALEMRRRFPRSPVFLADMDVLNPYFRSREKADFLAGHGVTVIGNNINNAANQDLPAISGQVQRAVIAGHNLIVDLAGSVHGLKTLTFFKDNLSDYEMWVTVNAFREESGEAEKVLAFIREAQAMSGLRVTGLVNTSHMLRQTKGWHVLKGQELAREVSEKSGIPLVMTFVIRNVYEEIKDKLKSHIVVFDKLIMREEWQS